jgi:ketosteroid isomerase-like protein
LVERYVDAWERGDVDAIVAMLTDDASFAMPPYPFHFGGRDDIAAFLPSGPLRERWRLRPVCANGQLAFGCYVWDQAQDRYEVHSIDLLTLRADRIAGITAYLDLDAGHVARLGLPDHLHAVGTS